MEILHGMHQHFHLPNPVIARIAGHDNAVSRPVQASSDGREFRRKA